MRLALFKGQGYGLIAARAFSKGELIFSEKPILKAQFSAIPGPHQTERARAQWAEFAQVAATEGKALTLAAAFPKLFLSLGFPVLCYENFLVQCVPELIGQKICNSDQSFAGTNIEKKAYTRFINRLKWKKPLGTPTLDQQLRTINSFFRFYSFGGGPAGESASATNATQDREAYVYLLASLINHCCKGDSSMDATTGEPTTSHPGPNCSFRIGPNQLVRFPADDEIVVQAERDIADGDELTWDYGKANSEFVCLCKTCTSKALKKVCRVL
ncbi:hypothetical protein QBC35DRAFT_379588 [Podospora australis]|uniref:SET domain-containing protein n=1 Tax=Podospora australis TaxID=1536484 RepID=A0AAN6WWZ3_9PEZI|nr:hypothetical protein QBC35DRAFT_379588 [Podospora australis]